jgi:hypothetical protein
MTPAWLAAIGFSQRLIDVFGNRREGCRIVQSHCTPRDQPLDHGFALQVIPNTRYRWSREIGARSQFFLTRLAAQACADSNGTSCPAFAA